MFTKVPEADSNIVARQLQMVAAERNILLFSGIIAEHEVGISPRRLGRFHFKGIVVDAVGVGGTALAVTLGQATEQSCAQAKRLGLFEFRNCFLLLLCLLRVLNDGVTVKRSTKVNLQNC